MHIRTPSTNVSIDFPNDLNSESYLELALQLLRTFTVEPGET
jgi:hypothetical protein